MKVYSFHHPIFTELKQRYAVVAASWGENYSSFGTAGHKVTHYNFVVNMVTYTPHDEAMARDVARLVISHDPAAKTTGSLVVSITQTFRLGILTFNRSEQYMHSPSEWLEGVGVGGM